MQKTPGLPWIPISLLLLFLFLAGELVFSVRRESQTFDESAHLYSGYVYWKTGDFGVNPEHPPVVKLLAAIPLLPLRLELNPVPQISFRGASSVGGRKFLYSHNAEMLLFRARMMASLFTFALAALVFLWGREMFGAGAGLIALAILVFEPNLLAHGALVTTDMAASAMLFGTVCAFYRYVQLPSFPRLLVCGVMAGLTLGVKHSGIVIFPILLLLAVVHLVSKDSEANGIRPTLARRSFTMLGSLCFIAAFAVVILWACYGFRYAARPGEAPIIPSTSTYLAALQPPAQAKLIGFCERHHILPEAYLYGLTDIAVLSDQGRGTFLFGRHYPRGIWYYFPGMFLIKTTLGFLLLLAIAAGTLTLWRRESREKVLFLLVPAGVYLAFAMHSNLDIGFRHVLPVLPFLIVFMAGAAWLLMSRSRTWAYALGALLLFHAASSMRAYPAYLAYSNEIWGGPSKTYRVAGDSNIGWTSGLAALQRYIAANGITDCWFAYYGPAELSYFHLPCRTMPTTFSLLFGFKQDPVPEDVSGPVFVLAENLTNGAPETNTYTQFRARTPDAVIDGEVLVFNGTFHVPEISAMSYVAVAQASLSSSRVEDALQNAQKAEALAPELIATHRTLEIIYARLHDTVDAEREYQEEVRIYRSFGEFIRMVPPPVDPFPAGQQAVVPTKTSGN